MRSRSAFTIHPALSLLIVFGLLAACSLEKNSAVNRNLQNLTAHYNILFNANELLRQKQEIYAASFPDNYNQILRVYQDTTSRAPNANDKELDGVIDRAHNIINIKEQSKYIGDAYLLLAKASYLYGNYFNANEYCNYVIRTYPQNVKLVQSARSWRVRTLLNLDQPDSAKAVSDTSLQVLEQQKKKTNQDEIYTARLQYDIDAGNYPEGEAIAKQAIAHASDHIMRRRLTFILAQLQEVNRKPLEAAANYRKVEGSNAAFEMAFNAQLNRIRIEDQQNNRQINRIDRLRALLRNENNKEFTDQIYFQIGELYLAQNDINNAVKNYRLSLKYSGKNQAQKGLTYLRLADIDFKNLGDYVAARKMYDSTLLNLPPNYPDYRAIQLKANNLEVIAQQMRIIGHEDTLQQLARLKEPERSARIDELVKQHAAQQQAAAVAATAPAVSAFGTSLADNTAATTSPTATTFYFYNVNAVSQGFTDFKRRWGNRKLEDNWRRANRSNSDITTNTQNTTKQIDQAVTPQNLQKSPDQVAANNYKQELIAALPLTDQAQVQSNARVFNAYYTLANFYRDVLEEPKEAITTYELLVNRFPGNGEQPAIYYNLYRLYSTSDTAKSNRYKRLLLSNYGETPFAKVILDPEYGQHLNDQDAEFNAFYNQLYDLYTKKQYDEVIKRSDEILQKYSNHRFAGQIAYLRAMAAGHNEKLDPFIADLQRIAASYPNDPLIVPLVNQHLDYIKTNQAEFTSRPTALVENDNFLSPFLPQPEAPKVVTVAPKPAQTKPAATASATATPKIANSIFSLRDTARYYFVVNVASGTTNLASSRFGIGQFNRANFAPDAGINHQLKDAGDNNQLIYVGVFHSLQSVKEYARAIIPLMPQIMKVPADKYSFFIITQENLDKLADKKMLDLYIDFYQKNY